MRLIFDKSALRQLARLQPKLAAVIRSRMEVLAADPFGPHPQAKALKGERPRYRLRVGDWRILYTIDSETQTVRIESIAPRERAYE